MRVNIRPVEIIGHCPAGLTLGDECQLEGMELKNPKSSRVCWLALSQLPIGQGIWQVQSGERFFSHVSCPGCIADLEHENRVVFLLGHGDKWELCQIIAEYLKYCKSSSEPALAKELKEIAIGQQSRGEYEAATETMKTALKELLGAMD